MSKLTFTWEEAEKRFPGAKAHFERNIKTLRSHTLEDWNFSWSFTSLKASRQGNPKEIDGIGAFEKQLIAGIPAHMWKSYLFYRNCWTEL